VSEWIIDTNDCPTWVDGSYRMKSPKKLVWDEESFEVSAYEDPNRVRTLSEFGYGGFMDSAYCRGLKLNEDQTIYVPAGVNLNVRLYVAEDRENKWAPVIIPRRINLKQGEILDLGRCEIEKSIPVLVKVVDSAGKPIEGVPVDNPISQSRGPKNTDSKGIVRYYVYPNSEGEFSVRCQKHNLCEYVSYEVGGEEDSGREFLLLISDELIRHFVK